MDNKNESFEKIEKENFEDQIMIDKSEPIKNFKNQNHQQINYPQNKPLIKTSKRSKKNIISLIAIVVSISLILTTLFLPWYCISIGMSMFFFMPVSMNADMNFHLDKIGFDADMMGNSMQERVSYDELEQKAQEQGKNLSQSFFDLFQNMTIMVIIMLLLSIISLIGVLGVTFDFGNKTKMKKIGLFFGILTFVIGISTAGYFMVQWDSNTLNQIPSLDSDDSSDTETINLIDPDQPYAGLDNVGFWDSKSYSLDSPGILDSDNSSLVINEGSGSLFTMDLTLSPGLSWYIIIFASIMSLVSAVILLNKKLKIVLITILVCALFLTGLFIYLSISVGADESSSPSLPSWGDNSDPVEMARFIGTWKLDVNNTVGHSEWGNISEETWIFWENETFSKYEVSTQYESSGSGSMSCVWSAYDNSLSLCSGAYDYIFSDDDMKVTLTKDYEKIILNKTVG